MGLNLDSLEETMARLYLGPDDVCAFAFAREIEPVKIAHKLFPYTSKPKSLEVVFKDAQDVSGRIGKRLTVSPAMEVISPLDSPRVEQPLRLMGYPVSKSYRSIVYNKKEMWLQGNFYCNWGKILRVDISGVFFLSISGDEGCSGGPAVDNDGRVVGIFSCSDKDDKSILHTVDRAVKCLQVQFKNRLVKD